MKRSTKRRNAMATTMAMAAALTIGGATQAGDGVHIQQTDAYGNGHWNAQATTQARGSELGQTDPYGNGHWNAQTTTRLRGSDIDQVDPYGGGRWTAQRTTRHGGVDIDMNDPSSGARQTNQAAFRENRLQRRVCNSRMVRHMLEEVLGIDLQCP